MKKNKFEMIVIAAILLIYNACSTSSPSPDQSTSSSDKKGFTYVEKNIPLYSPVKGPEHAEITIIDFSGFL